MATATAFIRRASRRTAPDGWFLTVTVALGLLVVVMLLSTRSADLDATSVLGPIIAIVAAVFLFFSERLALSMALIAIYVGTIDGFIRLKTGSDTVTLLRDLLVLTTAAGALLRMVIRRERLATPPMFLWIVGYVGLCLVQLANPDSGGLVRSVAGLRPHLIWLPLFFIAWATMRDKKHLRAAVMVLLVIAAANGIVSFVQFGLTPTQLGRWGPGYAEKLSVSGGARIFIDDDGHKHVRPPGLGGDMGFGGNVAALAVPGGLALLMLLRRRKTQALLTVPLFALAVVGVATSQSRTAVVGSVLVAGIFLVLAGLDRKMISTLFALALVGVIASVSLGHLSESAESGSFSRYSDITPDRVVSTAIDYRSGNLVNTVAQIKRFPFGAGLGTAGPGANFQYSRVVHKDVDPENELNYLVIELGIPGLVLVSAFLLYLCWLVLARMRWIPDRETRLLAVSLAAPMILLLINSFAGISTASPPSAPYLWFAAGVIAYWGITARREHIAANRPSYLL